MSEMVERVASILGAWERGEIHGTATPIARLVIAAMREPTADMLNASWRTTVAAPVDDRMACLLAKPKDAHIHKMLNRYRAAVDEALKT